MLIENVQLGGTQIGIIIPHLFELIRENSRSMYKKNLIVWTKNSTFLLQELKTLTCTPECSWRIFSWTIKESSFISQSNKKSYWINGLFLGSFRHPTLFKIDSFGFNRCISFSFTRHPGCPFLQTLKKGDACNYKYDSFRCSYFRRTWTIHSIQPAYRDRERER